jgi:predicted tellurium resistance membrane protein TerC
MASIVPSGDNAVVIAMASHNLPENSAAVRSSSAARGHPARRLLRGDRVARSAYLKLIGGALLWIGVKLIAEEEGDAESRRT